jgi:PAS domain S-box-containing protein
VLLSEDGRNEEAGTENGPAPEPAEDLEDLFQNAPCGYLSLRPSGEIFRCNTTFITWTGFGADELLGKRFQDLLNMAGRIFYETHFAPLLRMQGFFHEVALDLVGREGKRLPTLVNAVERRDGSGAVHFIRMTIFNATDRRRYERELVDARAAAEAANNALRDLNAELERRVAEAVDERMKAEESLRQSQKMEAVGQLTGGVAHDFNNLLTIIIGGLDTIGRQIEKIPESHEVARIRRSRAMALHGAQRAAALTARLLAFSRLQPLDPKPLDPGRLISGLADLLQRTLGETIALETVSAAGLWRAFADPTQLENALINLAVNARDAMTEGGRLTIETQNVLLDEAYVAAFAEPVAPGQYVLIAVSDTGHGMTQETLAQVFEPFFTTKETGKGTGLGLSQVYGFVRQTGGHIRIYSEVGEGTSVKLYLPRALGVAEQEAISEHCPLVVPDGGPETILVVEDYRELRDFSTGVLRELGYEVLEASSGRAALELLERGRDIDLLFTDVVLPDGMSGRQLADEALRRRPDLKVLFTTGYTRNAIVHNGTLDPGVNLISKPFTYQELAAKVRALLDRIGSPAAN